MKNWKNELGDMLFVALYIGYFIFLKIFSLAEIADVLMLCTVAFYVFPTTLYVVNKYSGPQKCISVFFRCSLSLIVLLMGLGYSLSLPKTLDFALLYVVSLTAGIIFSLKLGSTWFVLCKWVRIGGCYLIYAKKTADGWESPFFHLNHVGEVDFLITLPNMRKFKKSMNRVLESSSFFYQTCALIKEGDKLKIGH
ncbi:MAG TPA: hypothetical protein P5232_02945 [Candidatus Moranbacteria bacterium]|nr:hypothetical protein [Candidatus Moranbacteria bacterium]